VHLAAQPGVRYSIDHPHAYADSNLVGFLNVLEGCRHGRVGHLVYASSSSVYGANQRLPFSVQDNVDHPVSLYAATKKANEAMAHAYAHLYRLPATGLRFFTVYGPWGRPAAPMKLPARCWLASRSTSMPTATTRGLHYIDDIVEGAARLTTRRTGLPPGTAASPTRHFQRALALVQHRRPPAVR
jgi:UDP-glucuronate 4-epimerase